MRNAEATREKILDAAFAEFAAHGIAGGRVDRIALNAGCNKNLIYVYFGSKETLFNAVLEKHLSGVYDEIHFDADDLPGYATKVFDFSTTHPDLMRLIAWFTLEQESLAPAKRAESRDEKLLAIAKSQKASKLNKDYPPGFMLTAVMALATAWASTGMFAALDPDASKRQDALRKNVRQAVRRLVAAR